MSDVVRPALVSSPRLPECQLQAFHPGYAGLVLSWVRDAREAYWLAPRSAPPLTIASILEWPGPGRQPFIMIERSRPEPVGYGELNVLEARSRRFWLGHLIVDPERRGCRLGISLTQLLLKKAFIDFRAREVTLVVFAENHAAIGAYRAVGFFDDGFEVHEFPAYKKRVRMQRMSILSLPR